MLHVRTYLQRSSIHGTGVFAAEDIASGRVVWEFQPELDLVLPRKSGYDRAAEAYLKRFSYFDPGCGGLVLCGDNAKWMNHSDRPNTVPVLAQSGGPCYVRDLAASDIAAGDEITCDYCTFDRLNPAGIISRDAPPASTLWQSRTD